MIGRFALNAHSGYTTLMGIIHNLLDKFDLCERHGHNYDSRVTTVYLNPTDIRSLKKDASSRALYHHSDGPIYLRDAQIIPSIAVTEGHYIFGLNNGNEQMARFAHGPLLVNIIENT